MLEIGSTAPDFVLQNDKGVDTSLTDLLCDGPLILYFYPADFTPGCTKEACTIRDLHDELLSVGLKVAGVSPQDVESHARFRDTHSLPFTLLSDPEKVVVKMFDVDGPFGIGVRRATFLIGEDQKIQASLMADVLINRHKEFIDKAIQLRESTGMKSATS